MLIPAVHEGYNGFELIAPLVTKESPGLTNKNGILMNQGFIPHEFYHIAERVRTEDAETYYDYEAYVTDGDEKNAKASFFKTGNVPQGGDERLWGHIYLPDMVAYGELVNYEKASVAML
mmetsp:Transcript_21985/g.18850  ORF Transcript_21985/g.18850 Transcript_21985/m.18850 type:complete len:119 (+) Transcript_21985:431-787(+)